MAITDIMVMAKGTIPTWKDTRASQDTAIIDNVMAMATKNPTVSADAFFVET